MISNDLLKEMSIEMMKNMLMFCHFAQYSFLDLYQAFSLSLASSSRTNRLPNVDQYLILHLLRSLILLSLENIIRNCNKLQQNITLKYSNAHFLLFPSEKLLHLVAYNGLLSLQEFICHHLPIFYHIYCIHISAILQQ